MSQVIDDYSQIAVDRFIVGDIIPVATEAFRKDDYCYDAIDVYRIAVDRFIVGDILPVAFEASCKDDYDAIDVDRIDGNRIESNQWHQTLSFLNLILALNFFEILSLV